MSDEPPLTELPDDVTFTLEEVADLLFVVDIAVEYAMRGSDERTISRRVQRLITARLWPDLGELLGDHREEGE